MKRRQFVGMAVPLAATGLDRIRGGLGVSIQDPARALVLQGGRLFQGGRWQTCDVGIDSVGKLRFGNDLRAAERLDVAGKVIAPGFIDILADNATRPETTYRVFEKYKVSDGVTTALQMHGGSADCGAYYARFGRLAHAINYGVSTFVLGIRNHTTNRSDRLRLVERNLDQGALGVSHSLEYQPAPFEEMLEYARLARRYDRPLVLHLRYSSAGDELAGVEEALLLAKQSGARVHLAHLHSTGGTFHMEEALEKIRNAIASGSAITACVYPYSYWATYLNSRRFDPGWQERYRITYGDLRVVGSEERLTAASFARHRLNRTLVAVPEGTMPITRTFDLALREDFSMIGSDGGIQREPRSNSHPRGAACFSTAIRYALDTGMALEQMLAKMTLLPRNLLRPALKDRGILEEGSVADLTVFDPTTVRGNATVENPNQISSGIELVVVGGKIAYRNGEQCARNGKAVRY